MRSELNLPMRLVSALMAAILPLNTVPFLCFLLNVPLERAARAEEEARKAAQFQPQAPKLGSRGLPTFEPAGNGRAPLHFSDPPTEDEIFRARLLEEPMVPDGKPTAEENSAAAQALSAFQGRKAPEDLSALETFVASHPEGAWAPSVELNLGLLYRANGHFTKAIQAWQRTWKRLSAEVPKRSTEEDEVEPAPESAEAGRVRAMASRAVGELAEMYAWIGRYEWLEPLFAEVQGRDLSGPGTQRVAGARAGFALMQARPEVAFRCGPMALGRILAEAHSPKAGDALIHESKSQKEGMSLVQVRDLAQKLGMHYQMARRSPGAPVIVPSVVHWKLGHYGAVIQERAGKYLEEDPTFNQQNVWMTAATLDEEASGYFLVPEGALPKGWTAVGQKEGAEIWGRGNTGSNDPNRTGAQDAQAGGGCSNGMATYSLLLMTASLRLTDTPLFYRPPVGPPIAFSVAYAQLEANQPATFGYTNFGPKWTSNWLSYVEDDHTTQGYAKLYQPGGGAELYTYNATTLTYARGPQSHGSLTTPAGGGFVWTGRDGSTMTYAQADAQKYFLTQVADPAGNTVTLSYDTQMRLVAITDAAGQVTTLSYAWPGDSLKVTRVTDPFGRHADFTYTTDGHLASSADMLGIVSSYAYGGNDFIATLTTPYGNTLFSTGGASGNAQQWIQATDPMGATERCEFNQSVAVADYALPAGMSTDDSLRQYRNSFHWGKEQYQDALRDDGSLDYTKATIYHWMHSTDINVTAGSLESVKSPLTNRVFFNYQAQVSATQMGTSQNVTAVGRVLSNGQTQLSKTQYNALDMPVQVIDPAGRQTNFTYAANNLDLVQVAQQNGANAEVQSTVTYNGTHQPLTVTDASGETTTLTYNAFGQVLTVTDAKLETTTFAYDANGFLLSVTGPSSGAGGSATALFGYDGYGRVNSTTVQTASQNYTIQVAYDDLDRPTLTTYPDGTTEQVYYQKMDVQWTADRAGRWTEYLHDATRHLEAVVDPLQRVLQLERCSCGALQGYIDPKGNHTSWDLDTEGRPTTRYYPDGTTSGVQYDGAMSEVISATDAKGQTKSFTYNTDGSLAQVSYTNAQQPTAGMSYTYDPVYPRLASMTDGIGTTNYTYKAITGAGGGLGQGCLATVQGPPPNPLISYQYDELGRMLGRTLTDGGGNVSALSTVYDPIGRVSSVTNPLGTFNYSYVDATKKVSSVGYPNGQVTNYSYYPDVAAAGTGNGEERLSEIRNLGSSGQTLSQFSYSYDVAGRITDWQRQQGAQAANDFGLSYDAGDQLLAAFQADLTTGAPLAEYAYGYDAAGNRTSVQNDSTLTGYAPNLLNQLTGSSGGGPMRFEGNLTQYATVSVNGVAGTTDANNHFVGYANLAPGESTVTITATNPNELATTKSYAVTVPAQAAQAFGYDANGNLISDAGHTYAWDAEDRLVAINYTGTANATQFTYNGEGQRVGITELSNGVATSQKNLFWEGASISEQTDAVTGETRQFPGGGEVINGTPYYGTGDHLGSTRELTDATGAVHAEYDYDPYGVVNKLGGDVDATFQYAGYYNHGASGDALTPFRAYNPGLGRWLSRDPSGEAGGLNLYGYALGNPISNIDPLGLSVGGTAVGIGVGILAGLAFAAVLPAIGGGILVGTLLAALMEGAFVGAASSLAEQLYDSGGNFSCVDWGGVGSAALMGAAFNGAFWAIGRAMGSITELLNSAIGEWAGVDMSVGSSLAEDEGAALWGCFVAGTLVKESASECPIESVRLGDRVETSDSAHQDSSTDITPATWRTVRLRMPNPKNGDDEAEIDLLRPVEWLEARNCEPGGNILLSLPEFGLLGEARVESIEPCSQPGAGPGRVVTGTMTLLNSAVLRLHFAGTEETISPTASHRLYSENRHGWVAAGDLAPGEVLKTETGTVRCVSIEHLSDVQRVYNLEVEGDHRYFVGQTGVLSHNSCAANGGGSSLMDRYLAETGGRWGGAETRFLNDNIATQLEDQGFDVINGAGRGKEEWIPGSGGATKGGTWIDITATNGQNTIRIQTIDTTADGVTATSREAAAEARIRLAFPNDTLILIPKF